MTDWSLGQDKRERMKVNSKHLHLLSEEEKFRMPDKLLENGEK